MSYSRSMTKPGAGRSVPDRNRRRPYPSHRIGPRKKLSFPGAARGRHRHDPAASGIRRQLPLHDGMIVDNTPRLEIESRIRSLPSDEVIQRFHFLVDKRLHDTLRFIESFELDCIESRLDAEEQAELCSAVDVENDWIRERSQLVESIGKLLSILSAG
jgi:hypothetical protein